MVIDIKIERPDAGATLTLKCEDVGATMRGKPIIIDLPGGLTLIIDLGTRVRVFTLKGMLTTSTSKQERENIFTAARTWYNISDGESRLVWGERPDTSDYDFNVSIISASVNWIAREPGTDAAQVYGFLLVLQEIGELEELNP